MKPDQFAELVVSAIKQAADGPLIGGRIAQLEAR
jgi:hypothetical protein